MTGRHLTIRCDGHAAEHVAFGGPVFYGHAAHGFNEKPDHPDNVFWHQALKANALYQMLDGKHRKEALIAQAPQESEVQFRERAQIAGLPASELSPDQKAHLKGVVEALIEPYRTSSRDEVLRCLATHKADSTRAASPSSNRAIWGMTRSGISGGSKALRSSGTSAAARTFTSG